MTDYYQVHLTLAKPANAAKQRRLEKLIIETFNTLIDEFELVELCKMDKDCNTISVTCYAQPHAHDRVPSDTQSAVLWMPSSDMGFKF